MHWRLRQYIDPASGSGRRTVGRKCPACGLKRFCNCGDGRSDCGDDQRGDPDPECGSQPAALLRLPDPGNREGAGARGHRRRRRLQRRHGGPGRWRRRPHSSRRRGGVEPSLRPGPRLRDRTGFCSCMPTRRWNRAGRARPSPSSNGSAWSARARPPSASRSTISVLPRRRLEKLVGLRCFLFGLPYGDQGLLISRRLLQQARRLSPAAADGGCRSGPPHRPRRLVMLRTHAVTSAERFRASGYLRRSLRNLSILFLYAMRVPAQVLAKLYG